MADIILSQFNGIADSKWSGIRGSFFKSVGIDIHSTPGTITVQQALALDSASTITALCRVSLSVSTGDQLWFSFTDGKIWRRTAGAYALVYTTSPAAGSAGCLGAQEYNGFVYWATQNREHRVAITDLTAFASATANWATFTNGDAEFHPHIVQNGTLFIGDAANVAKVDSSATFTAACWSPGLVPPVRIKCMEKYGIDLAIGTIINQSVNYCEIVRWDTVQNTWQFNNPLLTNGINSFLWADNKLLANVGTAGLIHAYDGQHLVPFKRIPGTWTPTQYGEVYPSAIGSLRGLPIFGLSNSPAAANSTGNPADQGLYTFGRYSKDYPEVLNGPEYVISQNVTSGIEIGAILTEGNDLYVSWKNGTVYGVDKIDYANKYTGAYLETLVYNANPDDKTTFNKIFADYSSLPASTGLTFKYKINHATNYTTIANVTDATLNQLKTTSPATLDARAIQFRIEFTVSGNNAPIIENVGLGYVKLRPVRSNLFR